MAGGVCSRGYGTSGDVLVGIGVAVLELGRRGVLALWWWWWLLLTWHGLELAVRELLRLPGLGLGLGLCHLLLGDCLSCCGIGVGGLPGLELLVLFALTPEAKGETTDEDGSYACTGTDASFGCYREAAGALFHNRITHRPDNVDDRRGLPVGLGFLAPFHREGRGSGSSSFDGRPAGRLATHR